jgi:hypothetical protein
LSQNGFVRDCPQRHSTKGRDASYGISFPSGSISRTGPVTL